MKVKFYKGPWHGKSQEISHFMPVISVATAPGQNYFASSDDLYSAIVFDKHLYRPVLMGDGRGGMAYSMHPDGSMFYVYEGK